MEGNIIQIIGEYGNIDPTNGKSQYKKKWKL